MALSALPVAVFAAAMVGGTGPNGLALVGVVTAATVLLHYLVSRSILSDLEQDRLSLLRSVLDELPILVNVRDKGRRFVAANRVQEVHTGTAGKKMIGQCVEDVVSEERAARTKKIDDAVFETGAPAKPEEEIVYLADGSPRRYLAFRNPLKNGRGETVYLVSSKIDVTELRHAENSVVDRDYMFQSLINQLPIVAAVRDMDGRYLYVNQQHAELTGRDPLDIVGKHMRSILSPEACNTVNRYDALIRRTGQPAPPSMETQSLPDGTVRHYMAHRAPIKDASGNIVAIASSKIDFTEVRAAQERVRESESLLRETLDALQVIVNVRDAEGRFLFINRYQRDLMGLGDTDFSDTRTIQNSIWKTTGVAYENVKRVIATGDATPAMDREMTDTHGVDRVFMSYWAPIKRANGDVHRVVCTGIDVTDRVEAERASKAAARQMRGVLDAIPVMVTLRDADGRIKLVNKYQMSFSTDPNREIVGKIGELVFPWVDPGRGTSESREVAKSRVPVPRHDRQLCDEDGTIRTFMREVTPIFDDDENVSDVVMTAIDVTDRVTAEEKVLSLNASLEQQVEARTTQLQSALTDLRTTQDQMIEQEKMASLGGLVAGVSHEINTPLGTGVTAASHLADITRAFTRLVSAERLRRSDITEYTQQIGETSEVILTNLKRAADLVRSFKRVAVDQSEVANSDFRLKEYLDEIFRSLTPSLKRRTVDIRIDCDPDLVLRGDPGSLAQIITNLTINAVTHGYPDGGDVTISVTVAERPDRGIDLVFADAGRGMPAEVRNKVFEPFYTTTRGDGGSGLGMHIVYNIVTQVFGGTIRCDSEMDKGARFTIRLPASASSTDAVRDSVMENEKHG